MQLLCAGPPPSFELGSGFGLPALLAMYLIRCTPPSYDTAHDGARRHRPKTPPKTPPKTVSNCARFGSAVTLLRYQPKLCDTKEGVAVTLACLPNKC